MPIFEYECRDCSKQFETFVTADRVPSCPACRGANLSKRLSSPGLVGLSAPKQPACAMPSSPMCGNGRCGCAN
jgi:putative FmdB family regulatory protein